MPKIRVLLAHADPMLRERLRTLIDAQPDMQVVGDAATAAAAVERARADLPDVAVVDLPVAPDDPPQILERIRRESADTRLLALAPRGDPGHLAAALAAGATGYLVPQAAEQELGAAIRAVHAGRIFLDVDRAADLVVRLSPAGAPAARSAAQRHPPLSPREREVLFLVVRGFANREIADRLRVSVKTVETHRARLGRKLGTRTRAELVQYALLEGLLTPEHEGLSDTA